jgi:hypothetical protein
VAGTIRIVLGVLLFLAGIVFLLTILGLLFGILLIVIAVILLVSGTAARSASDVWSLHRLEMQRRPSWTLSGPPSASAYAGPRGPPAERYCPYCGAGNAKSFAFCPACGKPQPASP